ncbi:hypothetical protein SAMN05216226_10610 [Halovenus aranensis]|uniref:The GLUG motif-containing protein n=1 Tax=Halovenus aranensis TaxID=890420 RepID=A0A1G8V5M8_9EURY|nr:hypothetical protein [Halovenus aranensis]SDJ61343.1 hypothetical protein SAMN05216226_10610 [Halovenus aranensis]
MSRRRFLSLAGASLASAVSGCLSGFGDSHQEIADWHDLHRVRDNRDRTYVLTANLDATTDGYDSHVGSAAGGWDPIGTRNELFTGTVDGQGRTITDLVIDRPEQDNVGLFANNAGSIEQLTFQNAKITGASSVGVVAGRNRGELTVSLSEPEVTGESGVGTGTGVNEDGTMTGHARDVLIQGETDVGGFVGRNYSAQIERAWTTGTVTGESNVGGIVGINTDESLVSQSYAGTAVSGQVRTGGLVGHNGVDGKVSDVHACGEVSGESSVGGLVGKNRGFGDIENGFVYSRVSGTRKSGVVAGHNVSGGRIQHIYWQSAEADIDTGVGVNDGTATVQELDTDIENTAEEMEELDFEGVWTVDESSQYPSLQWQTGKDACHASRTETAH